MITPAQALQRLREGNDRFVEGHCARNISEGYRQCAEPFQDRAPLAIVMGCSDSRVPLELIFDQEFGALFLVRVAGSIATPSQIGSIEFAVQRFGTPLIVVLGHSNCGAVAAAVEDTLSPSTAPSPHFEVITGSIRPAVREAMKSCRADDPERLVEATVELSVRDTANRIREESPVLKPLMHSGRLEVIGAKYRLETGAVEFYE
jgi:carbonic anhydrase